MKKLLTLALLTLIGLAGFGQTTMLITPSKDTVLTTVTTIAKAYKKPVVATYAAHAPISLNGISNQTIRGDSITAGTGAGIYLLNCHDIHITKCKIVNGTTALGVGIHLENCYNITIDTCYFVSVATGVYVETSTNNIVVNNNQFKNMMGPMPRGQAVQYNRVNGSGNAITNNRVDNIPGQCTTQADDINLYMSNGTSSSPILVSGNWLRGGATSNTGVGIQLADGSPAGSYQTATNNILINTGSSGVNIAGGMYINASNNTVYGGSGLSWANEGVAVANYSGGATGNNTCGGNHVNWTQGTTGSRFDYYIYPGLTAAGWNTNVSDNTLTPAILPSIIIK